MTSLLVAVLGLFVAACALFIWAYHNKVGIKFIEYRFMELPKYFQDTAGMSRQQMEAIWDEVDSDKMTTSNLTSRRTSEIPIRLIFCK